MLLRLSSRKDRDKANNAKKSAFAVAFRLKKADG